MANVSSSNTTTLYSTTQEVPITPGAPVSAGTVNDTNFTTLYGQVGSAPNAQNNQTVNNLLVTGSAQINQNLTVLGSTTLNNTTINGQTFPLTDGSAGEVLHTDGSGNLYWAVDDNVTYTIDASATTGGANFNLQGSDASTDTIKFSGSGATTVAQTSANEITISSTDSDTTYTIDASTTTNGANFNLQGSDSTTDTIKFANGTNVTVTATDANTITIDSSATTDRLTNGTYTFILDASGYLSTENSGSYNPTVIKGGGTNQTSITVADGSVTTTMSDGFALSSTTLTQDTDKLSFAHVAGTVVGAQNGTWSYNLDGTTSFPNYKFPYADGTSNQVLRTNGSGVLSWYTPVDTNTTYTYAAGSVSGGANLTLTGSDSSTNTIKLTNGGHITAAYTSGTAVTLGSDATDANTASTIVARDASGNFTAGTGTFTGGVTGGTF